MVENTTEVRATAFEDPVVSKTLLVVVDRLMVEFGNSTEGDETTEAGMKGLDSEYFVIARLEDGTSHGESPGGTVVCTAYEVVPEVVAVREGSKSEMMLMEIAEVDSVEGLFDPVSAKTLGMKAPAKRNAKSCMSTSISDGYTRSVARSSGYFPHRKQTVDGTRDTNAHGNGQGLNRSVCIVLGAGTCSGRCLVIGEEKAACVEESVMLGNYRREKGGQDKGFDDGNVTQL